MIIAIPCTLAANVGYPGAVLRVRNNGTGYGIAVDSAGSNGLHVDSAGTDGVYVSRASSYGVNARGYVAGGNFSAGNAAVEGLIAHAYNNVSSDTTIHAYGRGYATGGWYTGGLLDNKEAPCLISPKLGIVDAGSARLVNGKAEISFDPLFSENVRTDIPIRVTVTPKGKPAGFLYVTESDKDGFTVGLESIPGLASSATSTTFDWIAFEVLKEYETSPADRAEWEKAMREREKRRKEHEMERRQK